MKQKLIIIVLLVFLTGIYSCENSLGYDPKVNITKIDNGNPGGGKDTAKTSKIIQVDSIQLNFKEIIHLAGRELFVWSHQIIQKDIKLDTSLADNKITMDLEIKNIAPDKNYKDRGVNEKIDKFILSFEGLLNSPLYRLDDATKDKNWFELSAKYIPQSTITKLNGSQIRADLVLQENNKDLGIIKFLLNIVIPEKMNKMRIAELSGNIVIFYKN